MTLKLSFHKSFKGKANLAFCRKQERRKTIFHDSWRGEPIWEFATVVLDVWENFNI